MSADLYRQLQPGLILSGHWEPLWVQPQYFEQLIERGELLERLHRELLPLEAVDFGAEGFGARIQPYQASGRGGEPIEFEVEIQNPFARAAEAVVQTVVPVGWQVVEAYGVRVRLEAHAVQPLRLHVTPPVELTVRRARVAVDLTIDGRRFGQQAEALVTVIS